MSLNFESILKENNDYFHSRVTYSYQFRIDALNRLETLIKENHEQICKALYDDLRKPLQESMLSEIAVTLDEIHIAKKNLKKWMKPNRKQTPLVLWPAVSKTYSEPLGTVLIIGPWNYPFSLICTPLIGAIAAGNCAILKPSELTTHTAQIIAQLVEKYFDKQFIRVVQGGIPETTALLNLKFDHIFFTGSTSVGKIVMQAAAKNLVPVTLELGGKSPVIVHEDADLDLAARRIVWGKFYNAGQTCVAPDYLYAHKDVAHNLTEKIKERITYQFSQQPKSSPDLARILNLRNCERLIGLIDKNKVILGGDADVSENYFAPTLMNSVQWEDKIMSEEIFGPILPILTYSDLSDVYKLINSKPKPLAAYFFSKSKKLQKGFINTLRFGGGCINDVVVHLGNPHLPFGGVGDSGIGNYHAKNSFQTFSHSKSVMTRYSILDLSARYAPYSSKKLNWLKRLFSF